MSDKPEAGERHLARFTTAQLVATVISGVKFLLVARWLGAENIGLVAILGSFPAVALNFLDVRPHEVVNKKFYEPGCDRRALLRACFWVTSFLGLVALLLGTAVCYFTAGYFVDASSLPLWWILCQCGAVSLAYVSNNLLFVERLAARFEVLAPKLVWLRVLDAAVILGALLASNTIDTYLAATLFAAALALLVVMVGAARVWSRELDGFSWMSAELKSELRSFLGGNLGLFLSNNVLGYVKMAHRSLDVLAVGFLFSDREVGIYRLGRMLSDQVYVFYDSLNQIYNPIFLNLLAKKQFAAFRSRARSYMARLVIPLLLAPPLFWVSEPLLRFFMGEDYAGLGATLTFLAIPFSFVFLFHPWVWAMAISGTTLRWFVWSSSLGCMLQFAVMPLLTDQFGGAAWVGAAGYACYYLPTYLGYLLMARGSLPQEDEAFAGDDLGAASPNEE